jgi:hypothetical protein
MAPEMRDGEIESIKQKAKKVKANPTAAVFLPCLAQFSFFHLQIL